MAPSSILHRFRGKLLLAMMLVISVMTAAGLFLAERGVMAGAERDLQHDFQNQLAALHRAESIRHGALTERCRTLMAKPRLHAALEDNALDLLYPTAKDELRDLMQEGEASASSSDALHAHFYRFLDKEGAVIPPPTPDEAGRLTPSEEAELNLHRLPDEEQIGFLSRAASGDSDSVDEVFTVPITSSDTGEIIAALVAGFRPVALQGVGAGAGMQEGIWLQDRLHLAGLDRVARTELANYVRRVIEVSGQKEARLSAKAGGVSYRIFCKVLNPGSAYPRADEVCIYPLTEFIARQHRLRWGMAGAGALLLVCGLAASQFASARLSRPVEELAVQSEVNLAQRARAEAVLATKNIELERSVRFSADASHQLKSPVTVLRAGLESLLTRPDFPPEVYDELSSLLHQTYRLTGVVNDLLLLSRMDAGRVELTFAPVNLTRLVHEWLDDLSALPDAVEVEMQTELPPDLMVAGEQSYTSVIVQNLLENARKYNRSGGRIRVAAAEEGDSVVLTVCNTGPAIPLSAQEHIFERFHRGSVGENVPGHGLGLNLARELARLHGGELWLVESNGDWTEFAVRFQVARVRPGFPAETA